MAKKNKKPESIQILGKSIKLEYKPLNAGIEDSDEYLFGKYMPQTKTIIIEETLEGVALRDTVFHELIHGVLHITGLSEVLEEKVEEAVVVAIENGLGEYFCL